MAKAREEKRLADEKARKERGEPEPAEIKKSEDEKHEAELDHIAKGEKKTTAVINTWDENERLAQPGATVEEVKSDSDEEDEAPPELEKVTTEELEKERAMMTEEQRQEQRIYEGLKDTQKVDMNDLAPKTKDEDRRPDNEEEPKEKALPELKEGEGQCSNLEELD